MRTLLDILVIWPMPAVWLAIVGAIFMRRRIGKVLLGLAVLFLVVGSLPVTGKALLLPLANAAPRYSAADSEAGEQKFSAIVVFLAGAFVDPDGRWWPQDGSIRRTVAGRQLHRSTGLPIILSGGAPIPGQVAETEVTAQFVDTPAASTILESSARDTFETGEAVARILAERFPDVGQHKVILVTGLSHIARASAVLRRFGIEPVASPLAPPEPDHRLARSRVYDFIPSARGLGGVGQAWREYVGLSWYLVSGRVRLRDLSANASP